MTLPASGELDTGDVLTELGFLTTEAVNSDSPYVRRLAGVTSGQYSTNDLYGKQAKLLFASTGFSVQSNTRIYAYSGYVYFTVSNVIYRTNEAGVLDSWAAPGTVQDFVVTDSGVFICIVDDTTANYSRSYKATSYTGTWTHLHTFEYREYKGARCGNGRYIFSSYTTDTEGTGYPWVIFTEDDGATVDAGQAASNGGDANGYFSVFIPNDTGYFICYCFKPTAGIENTYWYTNFSALANTLILTGVLATEICTFGGEYCAIAATGVSPGDDLRLYRAATLTGFSSYTLVEGNISSQWAAVRGVHKSLLIGFLSSGGSEKVEYRHGYTTTIGQLFGGGTNDLPSITVTDNYVWMAHNNTLYKAIIM